MIHAIFIPSVCIFSTIFFLIHIPCHLYIMLNTNAFIPRFHMLPGVPGLTPPEIILLLCHFHGLVYLFWLCSSNTLSTRLLQSKHFLESWENPIESRLENEPPEGVFKLLDDDLEFTFFSYRSAFSQYQQLLLVFCLFLWSIHSNFLGIDVKDRTVLFFAWCISESQKFDSEFFISNEYMHDSFEGPKLGKDLGSRSQLGIFLCVPLKFCNEHEKFFLIAKLTDLRWGCYCSNSRRSAHNKKVAEREFTY